MWYFLHVPIYFFLLSFGVSTLWFLMCVVYDKGQERKRAVLLLGLFGALTYCLMWSVRFLNNRAIF
jgi:hypothetical protein